MQSRSKNAFHKAWMLMDMIIWDDFNDFKRLSWLLVVVEGRGGPASMLQLHARDKSAANPAGCDASGCN